MKTINTIREAGSKLNKQAKREREILKRAKKIKKEQGIAMDDARKQAEAQLAAEEAPAPAAPAKPTVEELLTEIRNLLAANAESGKVSSSDGSETEAENK